MSENFDIDRERRTRDRAMSIVHDVESLRRRIETLPVLCDDMARWRKELSNIQDAYIELVRACDRNLKGK